MLMHMCVNIQMPTSGVSYKILQENFPTLFIYKSFLWYLYQQNFPILENYDNFLAMHKASPYNSKISTVHFGDRIRIKILNTMDLHITKPLK